jgi:hypothetical protein
MVVAMVVAVAMAVKLFRRMRAETIAGQTNCQVITAIVVVVPAVVAVTALVTVVAVAAAAAVAVAVTRAEGAPTILYP